MTSEVKGEVKWSKVKGKERKGKERKGKEIRRKHIASYLPDCFLDCSLVFSDYFLERFGFTKHIPHAR